MINSKKIPKIELHCHLDGSLRLDSVKDEIIKQGLNIDPNSIKKEDLTAPKDCQSLVEYLKTFQLPLMVLQTKDALERFSYEVFEDAHKDGCVYLELRFAPILHIEKGLSLEEIIESVIKGMNKAKERYDIDGGLILCCMKNFSEIDAIKTVEAGKNFLDKGVLAVDLAGPEDEGFSHKFIESMKLAKSYGYNITVHAGEAGSSNNVREAIELLNAQRIGHGIRSIDDKNLCNILKEKNIHLEICPTSNVQTKAVDSMKNHPIKKFLKDDISLSINTDNRTVSDTTMQNELDIVSSLTDIKLDDYTKMYYNTVGVIFSNKDIKDKLIKKYNNYIDKLEVNNGKL